jgi:hypothetical protein
MSNNDFSASDSFDDDCDITAFLEELKFRNSHGCSSDHRSRANSASSSSSSMISAEAASPLKSSKLPSPQQSGNSRSGKGRTRFSFQKSKSTSKIGPTKNKMDTTPFDPEDHLDLPFFDENGRCPPIMLPACNHHQQADGVKWDVDAEAVKLMWMMPNSEIV